MKKKSTFTVISVLIVALFSSCSVEFWSAMAEVASSMNEAASNYSPTYSTPTNSSSSSSSTNQSSGKSCSQYKSEYNSQLSVVIKNYDNYAHAKRNNYSTTSQAPLRKNLVSSQGRLKTIRREANAHGCSISASSYETSMP